MDRVIEIGAVRVRLEEDGSATLGERFSTFVDPGVGVGPAVTRLTGIRDGDLAGAPALESVIGRIASLVAGAPVAGHNVGFDLAFLERVALGPFERLDTAELASILMPSAPTYALQALAADAGIRPESAHRALDDAMTCAAVLSDLARRVRELPLAVLEEMQAYAPLLGSAYASFFSAALRGAVRGAWEPSRLAIPTRPQPSGVAAASITVGAAFSSNGPLARALGGYEDRPQQRALARAIEAAFLDGGALLAEAGTGVGKSLAYLVPAIGRALDGERVIVSTHTLPLQDQLVRKDLPALQAALGSTVEIAVLKGRSNYLCPRRWQSFRGLVATRDEARLLLKTLVWRTTTSSGDRAELNLLGSEADLWGRVSADDETCDARRCARVAGGCYLQRAREAAARAGIVVTNHALLLQDARMGGALLPETKHLVVDEAHRLEDVATDAFGLTLEDRGMRRALERVSHSSAVTSALRDERAITAEEVRREIASAHERGGEVFAALAAVLEPLGVTEDKLRVTAGVRASDEQWLPVELASERLGDALAGIAVAAERLRSVTSDEDEEADLASALGELGGVQLALSRGVHRPRGGDIVWIERSSSGAVSLKVAPSYLGDAIYRGLVKSRRSAVFTSATLAVAGSFAFALERFGLTDIGDPRAFGSPFRYDEQAILVVPDDGALPSEPAFAEETAQTITDIGRARSEARRVGKWR